MSDHDRGAYTPQTDAPLAFDPRRPSERRPLPMALIGSGVVLVVLLAGVAMVYRGGVRQAGEGPRPVGEPVMAVKTAPTQPPAQTQTADATAQPPAAAADVYAPTNQTAEAPKLAPAPEQPAARPPPSAATVALLSKPAAPDHVERPSPTVAQTAPSRTVVQSRTVAQSHAVAESRSAAAPAKPVVHQKLDEGELAAASGGGRVTHAEDVQAARATPGAVADKPIKLASASPSKTPVTAATSSAAASATSGAIVQIGAFSSTALADQGYAQVSTALPGRMGGKAMHTLALQKDGGTLYRTWVSGFSGRPDAVAFCEALKAKGKACFVKGV